MWSDRLLHIGVGRVWVYMGRVCAGAHWGWCTQGVVRHLVHIEAAMRGRSSALGSDIEHAWVIDRVYIGGVHWGPAVGGAHWGWPEVYTGIFATDHCGKSQCTPQVCPQCTPQVRSQCTPHVRSVPVYTLMWFAMGPSDSFQWKVGF